MRCSARTRARSATASPRTCTASEVAAFRAARSPINLARTRERDGHHHLRPRFRRRLDAFHRDSARQGRPADADLGALSGRLARGRGARQPHRCAQELTHDRRQMSDHDIPIDIGGLHAAYAGGLDPARVVEQVFDAIDKAADPGIFISLVDRKAARKAARKLGPLRRRLPSRCGASRSPSRTTSTWRGCRPRRRRPAFAYTPKANATRWSGSSPPARYHRQDQPRPVRDRPRRRAHALSGAAQRLRSRRSCRAGRARARPWRWRAGSCRSRSAPTRRARAACRPASTTSSGSSRRWARSRRRGVVPACRTLDCVSVFARHRG